MKSIVFGLIILVLVVVGIAGQSAMAGAALTPDSISITGVYSFWGTRYPQNTLTGPANSIDRETMWTTLNNHEPGFIIFNFNDRVMLTRLDIWNWNNNWNTIGMKDVEILLSHDWGVTFQAITNPATGTTVFPLTQGPYTTSIQPDAIPVAHPATHLKIDPLTWYGIRAGLSYVQFFGVRPVAPALRNRFLTNLTVAAFSSNNSTIRNANNTVDGTPYALNQDLMWLSNEITPWIVLDLNGVRRLNHLVIWNYAQSGYTNRGMKDIRLSGSLDGIVFWPLSALPGGGATLREALTAGIANTGEFIFVGHPDEGGSEPLAFLKIEGLTNHGGTLSGLSEIQCIERLRPPPGTLMVIR